MCEEMAGHERPVGTRSISRLLRESSTATRPWLLATWCFRCALAGTADACLSSVPAFWFRAASVVILAGALWLYALHGGSSLSFALAFLAPDLSLIAFAVSARTGVAAYNVMHSYAVPTGLFLVSFVAPGIDLLSVAFAWLAHVSFDRSIGLPYPRTVRRSNRTVQTVRSMNGTIVMVTGASDGIGKATALGLAKLGASVVMVCRDPQRGRAAQEWIRSESRSDDVELMIADLASQGAIRRLAADYKRTHPRLDVLVNNAGVNVKRRTLTSDGVELNFAVNYLAPFLLTRLLLDVLEASAPSRVINVASAAEQMGEINFDDLMAAHTYSALRAYCQSKLALVQFTYALARQLDPSCVTVNCLHPGVVRTKITQGMSGWGAVVALLGRPFAASPERGAETVLYLASSPDVAGVTGKYFENKREKKSSRRSYDSATGQRLWQIAEQLTGVTTERIDRIAS